MDPFSLAKRVYTPENALLRIKYLALYGVRLKALPLESATFCKRWTKTSVFVLTQFHHDKSNSSRYCAPFSAIYDFLPSRLSPSKRENIASVASASYGETLISLLVFGFMVVSHIISGSFSPSPLERCTSTFCPSSLLRISAFSASE